MTDQEKHFNNLTPAQAERLAILAEEAGEVVHIIGKILRHGFDSYNPYDPKRVTNRHLLEKELGDLDWIKIMLFLSGDINLGRVRNHSESRGLEVRKFLHHQP